MERSAQRNVREGLLREAYDMRGENFVIAASIICF